MDNKKTKEECVSETEQDASSRIETTRDYEMEEISDKKVKLLGDVSAGVRPKTTATETSVKIGDQSSGSSSPDTSGSNISVAAIDKASKSAREGAVSCQCAIVTARKAVYEGEKRLEVANHYAERVHPNYVNHYLPIINKYRTVLDCISESIRKAESAKEKANNAAENADKAAQNLSDTTRKSNTKDAELWATSAIATAWQTKNDAFKAAYDVLKATKKFWQEVDGVINLERSVRSFRKSIHRPNGGLKTSNVVLAIALLLGCIIIIIDNHVEIEKNLYYLVFFIGFALIIGSVLTCIVRIVGRCTVEENDVEKIMIRKELEVTEDRLREYDAYFAKNKITPVPSDSSENEAADSHATEETPLIGS